MSNLTHLSLFSGIGGLDLAAEWAGFRTVGQCEWADYPRAVLEKHWPGLPRWRDIRTLTGDDFYAKTGLRTVDIISGGFPCQPFSTAGKRRGKEDDRYLWPEMLRVISEIRPAWVVGENVAGIVSMALDTVLSDLESIGYACQAFVIPACAVDAPHRRDRVAIVAYSNNAETTRQRENSRNVHTKPESKGFGLCSGNVANTDGNGCQGVRQSSEERCKVKQIKVLVAYKTNGRLIERTQLRVKGYWYHEPDHGIGLKHPILSLTGCPCRNRRRRADMLKKQNQCPGCKGRGYIGGGDRNSCWTKTCERCGGTGVILVQRTNADRIWTMSDAEKRQALIDYFSEWAGIGDSYIFDLTRVKTAFAVGTMGLDDFEEWDESRIEELVDEFIKWLQQPAEGE